MLTSALDYELPDGLIAQHPPQQRDGGRLLVVSEPLQHCWVRDWPDLVPQNALVVLNDTRVMKARVRGQRLPGLGKVEVLFLGPDSSGRALPGDEQHWRAMLRSNKPLRVGAEIRVGASVVTVRQLLPDGTRIVSASVPVQELQQEHGHVPLPPYMRRDDVPQDQERYQTVFARELGSAAAPTAGLHLTDASLGRLRERGVRIGHLTLHVGAGTFRPVSGESLDDHPMHEERFEISAALAHEVNLAKQEQRPVVAVGTTVVRALESAFVDGKVAPQATSTRLLIQPGYCFRVVDALLTNFHAPRSTLLALVFAFSGEETVRAAYAAAIKESYRFLSYGDAMWLPRGEVSLAPDGSGEEVHR